MRSLSCFIFFLAFSACSSPESDKVDAGRADSATADTDPFAACNEAQEVYDTASDAVDQSCATDEDCVWGRWDKCGCPEPANVSNDFSAINELRREAEEICDQGPFCANNVVCPGPLDQPAHPPLCESGRCVGPEPPTMIATMEPTEIALTDTGMTDESFTVTVTLTGDYGEIDPAASRVYVYEPETVAVPTSLTETSEGVWVFEISYTWLSGLDAGTYRVDVEMVAEYESLFDFGFVDLVITP